ncbi:ACT domain-containing protein [Photobacterium minamisatsumaniensis]|uniref:ACT domain-containing protein n=1 Tax=Photobacterium minamisatsumaniensis TaxID=2910233 RepID=UPI003D0D8DF5
MTGITDLDVLLENMSPILMDGDFVFCTQHIENEISVEFGSLLSLKPLATFMESEGLTMVIEKRIADTEKLEYEGVFKCITLTVHSSLEAVGLTAAVAGRLAELSISANVIAAYYHDHVFVPVNKAEAALSALANFGNK